jgi:CUG-BP- and ETR3-like factor
MGLYAGAFGGVGAMRGVPHMLSPGQLSPYGHYYPSAASSPGPPIQTTTTNKGPDGANLFIFHIPNHFTNLDMYHLFCPYGTLLSVRIMVEKDTGRSRGFGFVSYDNPDSAAMAIKELNGFAVRSAGEINSCASVMFCC